MSILATGSRSRAVDAAAARATRRCSHPPPFGSSAVDRDLWGFRRPRDHMPRSGGKAADRSQAPRHAPPRMRSGPAGRPAVLNRPVITSSSSSTWWRSLKSRATTSSSPFFRPPAAHAAVAADCTPPSRAVTTLKLLRLLLVAHEPPPPLLSTTLRRRLRNFERPRADPLLNRRRCRSSHLRPKLRRPMPQSRCARPQGCSLTGPGRNPPPARSQGRPGAPLIPGCFSWPRDLCIIRKTYSRDLAVNGLLGFSCNLRKFIKNSRKIGKMQIQFCWFHGEEIYLL
jgi:hypothetical protein